VGGATLLLDGLAMGGLALRRRQRRRGTVVGSMAAGEPAGETEPAA